MISILFVCLANICRSPALEATFRHLVKQKGWEDRFQIDSSGIGWFHLGQHPDQRTFEAAKKRGIFIDHRAQQFQEADFDRYDYILAADEEVLSHLKKWAKTESQKNKVELATHFTTQFKGQSIPDPYYLSDQGFDQIMDVVIACAEGLLDHLSKTHLKE